MGDKKRAARITRWATETKKDPDAWVAARAAARRVIDAVDDLMAVAGNQVAVDFLRQYAEAFSAVDRRAKRRKTSPVPSVTGRHARNAAADHCWKMKLLACPCGPNGKPLTVMELARQKASQDHISVDAARRHLTRLNREIMAEIAAMQSFEDPTQAGKPNLLLRLVSGQASGSET